MSEDATPRMHATTILMVRKGGRVVIGGDGQVSLGQTIVKGNAKKVRRLSKGGVMAIGSGGNFALAAARALEDQDLDAEAIVRRSLAIAAEICVYTNANVVIEALEGA